jgi:hypothetical protein
MLFRNGVPMINDLQWVEAYFGIEGVDNGAIRTKGRFGSGKSRKLTTGVKGCDYECIWVLGSSGTS